MNEGGARGRGVVVYCRRGEVREGLRTVGMGRCRETKSRKNPQADGSGVEKKPVGPATNMASTAEHQRRKINQYDLEKKP